MIEEKKEEKQPEKVEEKKDIIPSDLNVRQEIFCRNFASSKEFFGNGTQSYIDAYQIDITKIGAYETARVSACELLTKPNVLNRINQLLDLAGFNDENVDKQTNFLINQMTDYKAKIAAIKEYNVLKSRVKNKLEMSIPDEDKKALRDAVELLKEKK